jgi:hypothetical protein
VTRALGLIIRGAGASAVGTFAMDATLYRRFRYGGGDTAFPEWESSQGLESWENAPGPALVAKKLLERVLDRDVPPRYARLLNNLTHWGYGLAAGAGYGLLAGSRGRAAVWSGIPFGAAVWASGYAVLPQFGVYEQIWKYDVRTLANDLSAHLVFGTATATAFNLIATRKEFT